MNLVITPIEAPVEWQKEKGKTNRQHMTYTAIVISSGHEASEVQQSLSHPTEPVGTAASCESHTWVGWLGLICDWLEHSIVAWADGAHIAWRTLVICGKATPFRCHLRAEFPREMGGTEFLRYAKAELSGLGVPMMPKCIYQWKCQRNRTCETWSVLTQSQMLIVIDELPSSKGFVERMEGDK